MRLIDADGLYEVIKNSWDTSDAEDFEKSVFVALATAPTIEERQTGRWEMKPDPYGFFDKIPVCSECGCTTKMREVYKFCPDCGADMRGEEVE